MSDDLISRAAAIEAVEKAKTARTADGEIYVAKINAEMNIQLLPSAQPEIIRCRECKYSSNEPYHGKDVWICNRTHWARSEGQRKPDDFCSYAERRDDVRNP